MNIGLGISLIIIAFCIYIFRKGFKINTRNFIIPGNLKQLLTDHVAFFNQLDEGNKSRFENRVTDFLKSVAIRAVDTKVEDLDRVLVAAGAIIPIFSFPDWRYNNISEVLLYKGTFDKDFSTRSKDRNVLGMVGDGAMHREMVLSQPSLRSSFSNQHDGQNTAIHEFAHLIDKADGATDGQPEYLIARPYLIPWVKLMHETISEMKTTERSDINMYGATNDTEFFAVVSEYFFERTLELKEHHPQLFEMLENMFHPVNESGQ
jgi:Mlc titration factor MtfA (ptsG expression regulator)